MPSVELQVGPRNGTAAALIGSWQIALESAATAVHAGWAAHTLSREAGGLELNRIQTEKEWLARFDWRSLSSRREIP